MGCCNSKFKEPRQEKKGNQLPAMDQVEVEVSRARRRFMELDLETSLVLDVEDIPNEDRLEIGAKMPNLVSIVGLGEGTPEEESFVTGVAGQAINHSMAMDSKLEERVLEISYAQILDVTDIPHDRRLEAVKNMPNLVSIVGLRYNDVSFVESVATINRNIVHLKPQDDNLLRAYIESAKKNDPNFTGSSLITPIYFPDYQELTSKYPDLDIKCLLDYEYNISDGFDGDRKCDLAVTKLWGYVLLSSQPNLLNRTINVTKLDIEIIPDNREFTLFTILNTITVLPLKFLILWVTGFVEPDAIYHCYDGDGLMLPLHRKYTMTALDYVSLQQVLSVESLRSCELYLDCVLDVHAIYQSFLNSTNNNFKKFSFDRLFNDLSILVKSYKSDGGYYHLVDADSIPDFDIGPLVQKFMRTPARYFGVHTRSDKKWADIMSSCEHFTSSRQDYTFTLRRMAEELFVQVGLDMDELRFNEEDFPE